MSNYITMLVWDLKSIDVVMMINHNQPKMQKNLALQNPYSIFDNDT